MQQDYLATSPTSPPRRAMPAPEPLDTAKHSFISSLHRLLCCVFPGRAVLVVV
jgi:hypothetical protein